jgi:site-specific recombinase XerD
VFANNRTGQPLTTSGVAHVFDRAVGRAGITTGDVTLHTLRHSVLCQVLGGPPGVA